MSGTDGDPKTTPKRWFGSELVAWSLGMIGFKPAEDKRMRPADLLRSLLHGKDQARG